ncbi:MAG: alpha/beta hydrolase [Alphaproteobacteria bacterium]
MHSHQRSDMTRRSLIAGAAVAAAVEPALAQQTPAAPAKGPPVWLDLDQKALDDAYDQSKYAPNIQQVLGRYATNSDAVRARLGAPKRLSYGSSQIEGADLYPTTRPNAPVHVFIHGGAWRVGFAKDYAFQAELFVGAGAHFIALDFINVLEAAGDLAAMAKQVRSAVAWVYKNAASFGGDPDRLYISGHSSGGHLGGIVMVTDWERDFGVPANIVKGGVLCSGLYDLKPVRLSARSTYVKFTDGVEQALSTQRHLDRLNAPLVLAYGTLETPEFQRQTREFAAAVKAAGKPVTLLVAEGYNHFEIIETMANPYGLLGRAALEQMKLSPA